LFSIVYPNFAANRLPSKEEQVKTADFEFRVPERLIPSVPRELRGKRRDDARLAVLDRAKGTVEHAAFRDLKSWLHAGDALVVNNSLVMHDRLEGECADGKVALVLFGQHPEGWLARVHPTRHARRGRAIRIGEGEVRAVLVKPGAGGLWVVRFEYSGDFQDVLQRFGRRHASALHYLSKRTESYRNVYATEPGSLEIPSAGLHFTHAILAQLKRKGVGIIPITLHIELSEMHRHISARNVEDHKVGAEWYRVTDASARALNATRRRGGRIFAVGTTSIRTLETAARRGKPFRAREGWSDLFIHPGYGYKAVDAMLTNLHQPRSSHLMLVAAFAGKEFTLAAYREIVLEKYRFDLFGDSMLIV
jgi:S-adenosylmethionine:tRNA ribosyltransferase-isomerase